MPRFKTPALFTMERKIIITKDGSHTIGIPEMNVTYHSIHGAIQESMHVFIEAGLYGLGRLNRPDPLNILEMGLGAGLNALLTLLQADKLKQPIHYTAIELFPLAEKKACNLNYCEQLSQPCYQTLFEKLHQSEWEKDIVITSYFTFHKTNTDLLNFSTNGSFDLIYFDAFAPNAQPELWTKEVFEKLYDIMNEEGVLVTYCSKGDIRRAMRAAGFSVEKIKGPPGKREITRALKIRI
jgi:tRNA U34 5-methylaminomethyl-2-thiouridine-forming methyltransferase MnmC